MSIESRRDKKVVVCVHMYIGLFSYKKEETLPSATIWKDCEDIMLIEVNQAEVM